MQETQNIMTNGIKYSIIQAAIAQMNELNAAYCPGNCGILTKVFSDTPRRCNKCRLTIGPGVSCCECRTCDYDMCIDCYVPLLEGRDVISTLSLARSGLTCEEIERLASLLETNSTITRLDLRNNRLEDSGAMFLSRMLMKNCTLRELELGNENIDVINDIKGVGGDAGVVIANVMPDKAGHKVTVTDTSETQTLYNDAPSLVVSGCTSRVVREK